MKNTLSILLKRYPLFFYLLPVFFVLHGFTENYYFVPVKDAVLLAGLYIASSLVWLFLFWLLYRNWLKAALAGFFIMAFHFFFGTLHDGLRTLFTGSFITKYTFILPVVFILFVLMVIVLKNRKKPLLQVMYYLNILFLLLILIDTAWLASKFLAGRKKEETALSKEFIDCNHCSKPDVYVIITDEYAGNRELKDVFHFDNTAFLEQLAARGFHIIPNSSSNYNMTPYSIASTLNMDYFEFKKTGRQPLLSYTYEKISNNRLLQFLYHQQYKFYNYSFFDFKGQPTVTQETFLPAKMKLITGQTFLSRIEKEIRYHLAITLKSNREIRKNTYFNRTNNEKIYQLTIKTAEEKTNQPKFVLTHLMMPHYPYYYNKDGIEFPFEQLTEGNQHRRENYIEYLQYGNKKILALVDHILKNASAPPVIILMGDHGFRHLDKSVDTKYYFYNLASVYLPGKNYAAFSDSLTNVNLLRTVLNTTFNQQLAYLKDTTYIMENP
ncbi:MAG: sulfatase-like hydrolase/transferase [Bacteroidota bacterium]